MYHFLNINEKLSTQNYYLSLLPKNNPSSVVIFDKNSKLVFQNKASLKNFSHISNADMLGIYNLQETILHDKEDSLMYEHDNKHYLIELKGI